MSKSPIIRYAQNPILGAKDIPYPASLVFNAGVCKFHGKYVMAFRDDYGFSPKGKIIPQSTTCLGLADSEDGLHWTPRKLKWNGFQDIVNSNPDFARVYDPRLIEIEGRCYICFAMDTWHGVRGGIAVTDDLEHVELLSLSTPDNRNMVLFPEKINGKFLRLERPFPVYSTGGEFFDIWISESVDCRYWGNSRLLLKHEDIPFANAKIGPAAPPIKTPRGWLATFHAVQKWQDKALLGWEQADVPGYTWNKEYFAGLMLLDLADPAKVLAMAKKPLIQAELPYELDGFRGSVIFPGGMVLEPSGEVKIYYGAADTVECLATADLNDLLDFCTNN